jgi:hypothetical protein
MNKKYFCLIAVIIIFTVAPNSLLQARWLVIQKRLPPQPVPAPLDEKPEEVSVDDMHSLEEMISLVEANKSYTSACHPGDIATIVDEATIRDGLERLRPSIEAYQRLFRNAAREADRIISSASIPSAPRSASASRMLTETEARNPLITMAVRVVWRLRHPEAQLPDRIGMHNILQHNRDPLMPSLTLNFETLDSSPHRNTITQTIIDLVTALIDSDETLPTTLIIAGLRNYTNPTVASLRLTTLDLHNNYLVTIRRIITPALRTLDVHDNYLTNFDHFSAANLERLIANNNQLTRITGIKDIPGLDTPLLKVLDVRSTRLSKKEIEAFAAIKPAGLKQFLYEISEGIECRMQ